MHESSFARALRGSLSSRVPRSASPRISPVAIYAIRASRGSAHTAYYARLAFLVLVRHRCRCRYRCRCIPSRFGAVAHCSWHSFWSSPIASGTRAILRAGPACGSLTRVSLLIPFALHPRPFSNVSSGVRRRTSEAPALCRAISRENKSRAPIKSEYRSAIFSDIYQHQVVSSRKVARSRSVGDAVAHYARSAENISLQCAQYRKRISSMDN